MKTRQHQIEHDKLGVIALQGSNQFIVGEGGYSSIATAAAAIMALDQFDEVVLAGTVAFTNGSKVVTGTGFDIKFDYRGDNPHLWIADTTNDIWYPIRNVHKDTELELDMPYQGATDGTATVKIGSINLRVIVVKENITADVEFDTNAIAIELVIEKGVKITANIDVAALSGLFIMNNQGEHEYSNSVERVYQFGCTQPATECALVYRVKNGDYRTQQQDIFLTENQIGIFELDNVNLVSSGDCIFPLAHEGIRVLKSKISVGNNSATRPASGGPNPMKSANFGDYSTHRLRDSVLECNVDGTNLSGPGLAIFGGLIDDGGLRAVVDGKEHHTNMYWDAIYHAGETVIENFIGCLINADNGDLYLNNAICRYPLDTPIPHASWEMFSIGVLGFAPPAVKARLHINSCDFSAFDLPSDWTYFEVVELVGNMGTRTFSTTTGVLVAAELDLLRATTHICGPMTGNVTVPAPVGSYPEGTELEHIFRNGTAVARTVTWNASFVLGTWTDVGAVADAETTVTFKWNGARAKWIQSSADNQWL